MADYSTQQEKYKIFYNLHHSDRLLILPNIWDPLSAILLESLSYPAVATASASVAFANGYDDGQHIPFEQLVTIVTRIVKSVNLPVSADIESGYAENQHGLKKNIKRLLKAGIVGINIEDTDKQTGLLMSVETQCQVIHTIRNEAEKMGLPLFINARSDVIIRGNEFSTPESRLEETIKRGVAYKTAGASCFFPIAMKDTKDIKTVISEVSLPLNVSLLAGIADLNTLEELGVTRVSLGPSFLKIAIRAMHQLALKLKRKDGLDEIIGNEITTAFMKDLVNKNYRN